MRVEPATTKTKGTHWDILASTTILTRLSASGQRCTVVLHLQAPFLSHHPSHASLRPALRPALGGPPSSTTWRPFSHASPRPGGTAPSCCTCKLPLIPSTQAIFSTQSPPSFTNPPYPLLHTTTHAPSSGPHFGLPRRASKQHHTENILTRLSASGRHCTVVLHMQAARPDLFLGGNWNGTSEILCLKHGDLGKVVSREVCKPSLNLLAATFPSLMASLSARCSSLASMPRLAAALASEPASSEPASTLATSPASKPTPELAPKPASPPQLETAKEQRQAQQQQMDQQQQQQQKEEKEQNQLSLAPTHPADCAVEESSRKVDAQVGQVHESLPPNTLLLVLTGCGDTPAVRRMMEWRWKRQQWRSTGMDPWDERLDALLNRMQERASAALCLATVKQ
ncbi:unnamed protein product [Closterium sp. NIES-65]|nr:unnamed protein product [Closterium sp. NIES-65]